MSWETHHCEVKTPPRETPVSTGRQRLELMDHQESWRGAGCLSAGSMMERGKGSPEAGSCLSRDGRIFWMVSRSETYVFEENSGKWGSLTRKRDEWTQGLIQIFERPSYGQANKRAGCSPGQNKVGSNGEDRVFYSKTDLVLIPPLTE